MNGRSGRAPPPQRGISGPKISTSRFKNVDMRQENSNAVTRAALLNRIKEVQEAIQLLKLGAIKSGDVQSLRRAPNNIIISPPQPEDLANAFVYRLEDTQATLMRILQQIKLSTSDISTNPLSGISPVPTKTQHGSSGIAPDTLPKVPIQETQTAARIKSDQKQKRDMEIQHAEFDKPEQSTSIFETPTHVKTPLCPPIEDAQTVPEKQQLEPIQSRLEETKIISEAFSMDCLEAEPIAAKTYKSTSTSTWASSQQTTTTAPQWTSTPPEIIAVYVTTTCAVQTEAATPPPQPALVHSYTETDNTLITGLKPPSTIIVKNASTNISPMLCLTETGAFVESAPLCERGCSARTTPVAVPIPAATAEIGILANCTPQTTMSAATPEGVPISVDVTPTGSNTNNNEVLLRLDSLFCCEWCGCKDATALCSQKQCTERTLLRENKWPCLESMNNICNDTTATTLPSPTETPGSITSTDVANSEADWGAALHSMGVPAWQSMRSSTATLGSTTLGTLSSAALDSSSSTGGFYHNPEWSALLKTTQIDVSAASTPSTCTTMDAKSHSTARDVDNKQALGDSPVSKDEEFSALAMLKLRRLSQSIRSTRTTSQG